MKRTLITVIIGGGLLLTSCGSSGTIAPEPGPDRVFETIYEEHDALAEDCGDMSGSAVDDCLTTRRQQVESLGAAVQGTQESVGLVDSIDRYIERDDDYGDYNCPANPDDIDCEMMPSYLDSNAESINTKLEMVAGVEQ